VKTVSDKVRLSLD